jgi:starch-binding outer membrane protein, SusD/RagB family
MRSSLASNRGAVRALCAVAATGLLMAGCDALDRALQVEAPGNVDASDLAQPGNAHLLVSGTIADFECALGAYIVNAGLLGNELSEASITAGRFTLDSRNIGATSPFGEFSCSGNPPGIYVPLSTAIWTSNNALARLEGWSDAEVTNRARHIATTAAYSGYAHTLMGEGFCSAVIEPDGAELTPAQVFAVAETRFTQAITAAPADSILNLAQLGRARVRLNLGNGAGSLSDANAVLARNATFAKVATASTASGRRWNRVGDEFFGGRITVAESYRNLTVGGQADPRVAVTNTNTRGHDNVTFVWVANKYGTARAATQRSLPVPLAHWREARLIAAEAAGFPAGLTHLNVLRQHHGLPLATAATAAEYQQLIVQERARELFLEGHHLNDLRRFNLPLVPAAGTPYPKGGAYGDHRCFMLPAVERLNNPNVSDS